MNNAPRYQPEKGPLLRKVAFLAATGTALLVGGNQDATHDKAQSVVTTKAEPEKEEGDKKAKESAEWERFQKMTEVLEAQGAYVQWNHPPEGPKNPFFVVHSSHVENFESSIRNKHHGTVLAEEYAILRLLGDMGLRKFAFEGMPSDTKGTECNLIEFNEGEGRRSVMLDSRPQNEREPIPRNAKVLTPAEIRRGLADPQAVEKFFQGFTKTTITGISSEVFMAGAEPKAGFSFTGAERPSTMKDLENMAYDPRRKAADEMDKKFQEAITKILEADGSFGVNMIFDDDTLVVTHVRLGNEKFDAIELQQALLTVLQETPEALKMHEAREAFIANELGADVVHFGNAHLPRFSKMEAKRSIGIVVPKSARNNYHFIVNRTDKRMIFLKMVSDFEAKLKKQQAEKKTVQ